MSDYVTKILVVVMLLLGIGMSYALANFMWVSVEASRVFGNIVWGPAIMMLLLSVVGGVFVALAVIIELRDMGWIK